MIKLACFGSALQEFDLTTFLIFFLPSLLAIVLPHPLTILYYIFFRLPYLSLSIAPIISTFLLTIPNSCAFYTPIPLFTILLFFQLSHSCTQFSIYNPSFCLAASFNVLFCFCPFALYFLLFCPLSFNNFSVRYSPTRPSIQLFMFFSVSLSFSYACMCLYYYWCSNSFFVKCKGKIVVELFSSANIYISLLPTEPKYRGER